MTDPTPQSFANHARYVPLYHVGIFGVLVVNLVWSLIRVVKGFSWPTVFGVVMAFALLGMFFYMRIFALTVQDRVIRLEMRLRLERLLAADLKGRIGDLTVEQLVGLRFASDEELPALVREVFEKNIADRKEIKRRVKNWQADHLRA
jgi:Family of unknown function (DUF6526)